MGKISRRFLGSYQLAHDQSIFGELTLSGSDTALKLHSEEELQLYECPDEIRGIAHTGERITLINCLSSGVGSTYRQGDPVKYHAEIFPHHVAIGKSHVDASASVIRAIYFTTTDIHCLFYDFDAFGHVNNADYIIDEILKKSPESRSTERGDHPLVCYFTGKEKIIDVPTIIGKISVNHCPTFNMGGPSGVFIKNQIMVSIEPTESINFADAIGRMHDIAMFLSTAAGRAQDLKNIHFDISASNSNIPDIVEIYQVYSQKYRRRSKQYKPAAYDLPLDCIRRPAEFKTVLSNWIARHEEWRFARARYFNCLCKGNKYGVDRLVAAANMFDILPANAGPISKGLAEDVESTRKLCMEMLRKLPPGVDRDGALSALGRMGQPSLPKKVAHRVTIVNSQLSAKFPELLFVSSIAVKCRNYFVHGSSDGIDFKKIENLMHFLTDTLEFVFAASDFIEAGWDAEQWNAREKGHSFSRFYRSYTLFLGTLKCSLEAKN